MVDMPRVKEKWTYPWKNMLMCAWHAKVKMIALTCFKNSRSQRDVCKGLSL